MHIDTSPNHIARNKQRIEEKDENNRKSSSRGHVRVHAHEPAVPIEDAIEEAGASAIGVDSLHLLEPPSQLAHIRIFSVKPHDMTGIPLYVLCADFIMKEDV